MLLLLSALAHAGEPDLSSLLSGAVPPDVVVSCAPTRDLEGLIASLPPLPDSAMTAFLDGLSSSTADPDGRLSLALWKDSGAGRVLLDWTGDLGDAIPLVEAMWEETPMRIPEGVSVEQLLSQQGSATLTDGALLISDPDVPQGPGEADLSILDGLLSDGTCGIAVSGLELKRLPVTTVGVSYPLGLSEDLTVRLRTREANLPTMGVDGPAIGGTSTEAPIGVLVLSADPLALLSHPPIMAAMGLSEAGLARVTSRMTIAPGLTMAVFGDPSAPTYAWTMGVTSPRGRPLSSRKLMRYTEKLLEDEGQSYVE
ncbi:MAG: hypothetical protein ACI8RZ_006400, partial [Myxococcota bacterium]